MNATVKTLVVVSAIFVAAFLLYVRRLDETPMYMSPDEVIIAVDAHSVASTGRDVEGKFLPLFFNIQMPGEDRKGWFFPMIFYFSALVLQVLPLSEWSTRLPTVVVGAVDVALIYLVARKLFDSDRLALFAAALLAMSPSHFILSRLGLDYLYSLPFTLGWLLGLVSYVRTGSRRALFAGVLTLGIGVFGYIASVLLMPLYLLITCLVLVHAKQPPRVILSAVAVFCLPLLVLVPWLVSHPTAIADTLHRYEVYDTRHLNLLQGLRSSLSFGNIEQLATRYWNFFNPGFLYLTGDSQMMFSTRAAGVFLAPAALFLTLGLYSATVRPDLLKTVMVAGFLTGPLAALIVAEDGAIHRAVVMLGFGVLLAGYGVAHLASARLLERPRRVFWPVGIVAICAGAAYAVWTLVTATRVSASTVALMLAGAALVGAGFLTGRLKAGMIVTLFVMALLPVQFALFHHDYFGSYRLRSAPWFGGNLRGALERMIELDRAEPSPTVYFSTLKSTSGLVEVQNRWMDAYWKFYLTKHGCRRLLDRTARFDPAALRAVARRSLVLGNVGDVTTDALVRSGELTVVELIPEVNGREPFFAILRR